MSRVKGVSYLASMLHDHAVVKDLCWQTTSNYPLCCPEYALAFGSLLWGVGSKSEGYRWSGDRLDKSWVVLYHQCLQQVKLIQLSQEEHTLLHSPVYGDHDSLLFQDPGYGGTEENDSTVENTEPLMLRGWKGRLHLKCTVLQKFSTRWLWLHQDISCPVSCL